LRSRIWWQKSCATRASNCAKDKEVSQLTTQLKTMSNNVCDLQAKLDESEMSLEALQEQVKAGDAFMEVNSLEAAVISWLWDLSPRNCTGTIRRSLGPPISNLRWGRDIELIDQLRWAVKFSTAVGCALQ